MLSALMERFKSKSEKYACSFGERFMRIFSAISHLACTVALLGSRVSAPINTSKSIT